MTKLIVMEGDGIGPEITGATAAHAIDAALEQTIADAASRTRDLGGPLGTKAFGERVAAALAP